MRDQDTTYGQQDELIEKVMQLLPLGAFRADAEGRCLFINKEMERLCGLSPENALGKGWMKTVHPDDIPAIETLIRAVLAEKKAIFDFIYRICHPEKGTRWCKVNARFIYEEDGTPKYYIGFAEDITAHNLREQALKDANEKLERSNALLDASQEISQTGGWEYDVRTDAVFRTRQMKIMLGLTDDTTTMAKAASMYEGPDNIALRQAMREAISHQKTYDLELRPLGSEKWFRSIGTPVVKDGKVELVRGAVTDITERKWSELALRTITAKLERSNLLLDVSQELSGTAGWEYNLQTGEVFWTRQAYLLHEVGEDFVPTLENTLSFYEEEDRHRLDSVAGAAVRDQKPYELEVRLITARNVRKWVKAIGVPIVKDGEVVLVKGALMDITQKKETELELIRARNNAENSARAKTDFLSVMSHEIRTPLNGIIGIANLLKLNYTMDQEEYITNLIFCADHLLQLINDILDLTKMENEKLELICAEVDLFQLVSNIRNQFRSLADAKGVRLKSFIDDETPHSILADPIRLGQILNNLISNAIKFTDQGEVSLLVKLVTMDTDKAVIHFSIKDTGIGIPEHLQDTIFESFKQVQQSAYRKHSGTGLGLTITRKLIDLHGSSIFVKSSPGAGTEFYFELTFELPNDKNSPVRFTLPPAMVGFEKKLKGLRLLFVEDNPINVMVATKQLEYFGVFPDCAHNGREALAFLSNNEYHVALLDLHMPEIDGYALAEIIRRQYPGTHIVIFTADIMSEVKGRLAKMNIYDILNKPFAPERMFDILWNVFSALPAAPNNSPKG